MISPTFQYSFNTETGWEAKKRVRRSSDPNEVTSQERYDLTQMDLTMTGAVLLKLVFQSYPKTAKM